MARRHATGELRTHRRGEKVQTTAGDRWRNGEIAKSGSVLYDARGRRVR